MTTNREAWLKQTVEEPIDPELPICDPHHHLLDTHTVTPPIRYLLDELLQDIGGGHNITLTVFIDSGAMYRKDGPPEMGPIGETEFAQGIAAQSASGQYGSTRVATGIVSHADLRLGTAVAKVLEAHIAASPNRFRGIRHISAWDASIELSSLNSPKGLLLDAKFREGFGCLQKYGLSFDAWLYHYQLPDLIALARAFAGTSIILDHIGTPLCTGPYEGKRDEIFQQWKKDISELATCSNVAIKLGGLGMAGCGFGWNTRPVPPGSSELAQAMAPYYNWCIEKFGTDRCMFESNFPVDKASYSYTVIWNAFKKMTMGFSSREKANLFHDTATRVYRLSGNP